MANRCSYSDNTRKLITLFGYIFIFRLESRKSLRCRNYRPEVFCKKGILKNSQENVGFFFWEAFFKPYKSLKHIISRHLIMLALKVNNENKVECEKYEVYHLQIIWLVIK